MQHTESTLSIKLVWPELQIGVSGCDSIYCHRPGMYACLIVSSKQRASLTLSSLQLWC